MYCSLVNHLEAGFLAHGRLVVAESRETAKAPVRNERRLPVVANVWKCKVHSEAAFECEAPAF